MDKIDGKKRIYGIDLGTTYSAIAFINDDGKPEIIPNSDCERITPSVVFFDEPYEKGKVGYVVVGKVAKEAAKTDPTRVISFVKNEMGTGWTREIDGITLTPEKVSAYILKRLAGDAKLDAGHDVKDVVITCPAYFGDAERKATIAAGQIAGLNVLRLLDEPVAAVLHYGLHKLPDSNAAIVYDLGGATFDVTVVAIEGGNMRVVCSDGNHRLGGKNWNERVVEYFASKFAEATGTDKDALMGDADTLYDLQQQAEIAKQTLTLRQSTKVKIVFGENTERIEITREVFDEMTRDLLDQTVDLTQKMLDLAAEKGITRIDNFVLAGGSTRMPQVMEMVREKFAPKVCNEPLAFEVDEAVAKGAAIFGNLNLGSEGGGASYPGRIPEPFVTPGIFDFTPRTSRSFGVRLTTDAAPIVENMIERDEELPAACERDFPIPDGVVGRMAFQIFTDDKVGATAPAAETEELGEIVAKLPRERPGDMKVRVRLSLSEDEILSVDVSYLTITPGSPAHVVFASPEGRCEEPARALARREIADLTIE